MAAHAKSHEKRFVDIHKEAVRDIQVKLIDYVKLLQNQVPRIPAAVPPAAAMPSTRSIKPKLQITMADGYPLIPRIVEGENVKKEELEDLIREYLSTQYGMFLSINHMAGGTADLVKNSLPVTRNGMYPFQF